MFLGWGVLPNFILICAKHLLFTYTHTDKHTYTLKHIYTPIMPRKTLGLSACL